MTPGSNGKRKKLENDCKSSTSEIKKSLLVSKRPNAAMKEKERLKNFNSALEKLQSVIPVKLPEGRKLHKKQTLQLACRYIQFLRDCLDGNRDYNHRSRFWCESDEEHSMINAIDAAASAGSVSSAEKTRMGREKEKNRTKSKSKDKTFAMGVDQQDIASQPHNVAIASNYAHWTHTNLDLNRALQHFETFNKSFSVAPTARPSLKDSSTNLNNFSYDVNKQLCVTSGTFGPFQIQSKSLLNEKVLTCRDNDVNDGRSEGQILMSTNQLHPEDLLSNQLHEDLDEAWNDLSEILF